MKIFKRSGWTDEYDKYMNIDFIKRTLGDKFHICLNTKMGHFTSVLDDSYNLEGICERINKDIFGFYIGSFDDEFKSNYVGINGYYYTNRDGLWRQVNNEELAQIEEYNKTTY